MKIKSSYIGFVLLLFLLVDVGLSTYQYSNLPLDGDLVKVAGPIKWYKDVLEDPIGLTAITEHKKYSGAGRFICHYATKLWFDYIPSVLNKITTNPVASIFGSAALFAMLLHIGFVLLAYLYAKGKQRFKLLTFGLVGLIVSVIVQYNSYYASIGIIDRSITYTFFYLFPLLLLLLFFYPIYQFYIQSKLVKTNLFLLYFLAPIVAFSGALIQPVFIIVFFIYVLGLMDIFKWFTLKWNKQVFFIMFWMLALCLYAFYVSTFNNEADLSKTIGERYLLILNGLPKMFLSKLAWPLLLGIIITQCWFIIRYELVPIKRLKSILFFILLFTLCYIFLLPLGGYRPYRPNIIRYDTLLPVTLLFIYLLAFGAYYCATQLKGISLKIFALLYISFVVAFSVADKDLKASANFGQQGVFYDLIGRDEHLIRKKVTTNVLTWSYYDYQEIEVQKAITSCLQRWNIIKKNQKVVFETD